MAKLNIAERRLPQDGRIKIKIVGREVDLRVSTLPTLYGESVVMRLLDRWRAISTICDGSASTRRMLARMEHFTRLPHGIFLVTGPTGSGKSTTLYSALKRINPPDKKIITVEDPGRIPDGRDQPDSRESADRPDLRRRAAPHPAPGPRRDHGRRNSRPRDRGHGDPGRAYRPPRLSTLHTNDAPSAITRLTDMGVENYLITSSLVAVLAQRLVRMICPDCRVKDGERLTPDGDYVETFRGAGCERCFGTGYSGRMGVFELMEMNDELRKLVMGNADAVAITDSARRNGMRNLREDGWLKVRDGVTTVDEVLRVTQEF